MEVSFIPQSLSIIQVLRSNLSRESVKPVSFDYTVNAIICSYPRLLFDRVWGDD